MTAVDPRQILFAILSAERTGVHPELTAGVTVQDWRVIADLARKHQVASLFLHRLRQLQVQAPPEAPGILREESFRTAGKNMVLFKCLADILERFHRASIPVILLKGAFLARKVYADLAHRKMGDIDLLIGRRDMRRARSILSDLGYVTRELYRESIEEVRHFKHRHPEYGAVIEPHWNLIEAKTGIHVDIDGVWARARDAVMDGRPYLEMAPEDHVLYLCVHNVMHAFNMGIRTIYDIVATLGHYRDELDWTVLVRRARRWNATRSLFVNLWLAEKLLGAPFPAGLQRLLAPAGFDREYLAFAEECLYVGSEEAGSAFPHSNSVALVWAEKSPAAKVLLVLRSIFLPRTMMASMYPALPDSWRIMLYYPVRVKDVLARHMRVGVDLFLGNRETVERIKRQNRIDRLTRWLFSE